MAARKTFQTGRSRQRDIVIAKLLTLPTIRAVSEECSIGMSTIHRWMRDPDFQTALAAARTELTNGITNQLRNAAPRAVDTLAEISSNPNAGEASRVAASARIIDNFIKTNTLESIELRLSQLESGAE
jgi:hypothetical protein